MKITRHTVAAATLALAAAAFAADTPKQKPGTDAPQPLVEKIDVRVINLDVVVTDKRGNHVKGLTKDDFMIYENGMQKPISNFYEVVSEPKTSTASNATTTVPPAKMSLAEIEKIPDNQKRRIIFYVDNLSLMPFNRNRVFKQMKEFAKTVLRPGDEAMVATFNRSMKIRAAFTRDPIQIEQTLDTLAGESALGVSNHSESRDVKGRINDAQTYDDALAAARQYAQSVDHDLRQSVTSLNALMSTLAGVEGKKVVVLTTEGFQMQPGREMFMLVDEVGRQKGWASGGTMIEGMYFNQSNLIQEIAKTANANGITLYAIHAGGLGAQNEDIMADSSRSTPYSVASSALSNSTESLQMITEMTGGIAAINTNNFAGAFATIEKDLDSYYSLGYRAGTERVDRQRSLEVRLKNPKGLIVRSRQSYVEKSTFAEMSDRVVANLLYRTKANDLKIAVRSSSPVPQDDGLFKVPIEIQIPMDAMTFLPQGNVYAGGFTVYVAVANKDGDMSDVSHKEHQITIPNAEMEKTKGKYYTYQLTLLMEPGLNKISVGVVDDVSNMTGFAKDQVIAQDMR
ncbi:MAG TPA: VWA domain-containing protein [Thermoanaerobaculia bacterium]|nr:VWA domain-containing protein [Thermoanaerobaculia bacterium]